MSNIIIEFYEVGAVNTQLAVTLWLMFRNDKTDPLLPTPTMTKLFWPHGFALLICCIPRLL
jgi:hypothetical protein